MVWRHRVVYTTTRIVSPTMCLAGLRITLHAVLNMGSLRPICSTILLSSTPCVIVVIPVVTLTWSDSISSAVNNLKTNSLTIGSAPYVTLQANETLLPVAVHCAHRIISCLKSFTASTMKTCGVYSWKLDPSSRSTMPSPWFVRPRWFQASSPNWLSCLRTRMPKLWKTWSFSEGLPIWQETCRRRFNPYRPIFSNYNCISLDCRVGSLNLLAGRIDILCCFSYGSPRHGCRNRRHPGHHLSTTFPPHPVVCCWVACGNRHWEPYCQSRHSSRHALLAICSTTLPSNLINNPRPVRT